MKKQRSGIVAGGNWIVDHVHLIDAWPPQDALANIQAESRANGGGPYNLLADLANLGAPFPLEAIGLVGNDPDGDFIVRDCQSRGIRIRQLRRVPGVPTSHTAVMTVASTGRRTFFHQRGANARLGPEHFDFSRTSGRFFHLGYLLLLDRLDRLQNGRPAACRVLRAARNHGLTVSLDCVSEHSRRIATIVRPALPEVDILFLNDFETERLTGIRCRSERGLLAGAVERAARKLVAFGVRQWTVIHFPEGAYALDARRHGIWQGGVRVPRGCIRGVAGAGDALAAGILFGLHEGADMATSLRMGMATAAASLGEPTCSDGIGRLATCLKQASRQGWRHLPPTSRRLE